MNHFQRLSRTGRNLHSHIHEAPMTKKHFQVTGYGMVSTFIAVTSSDCVICSTLRCRLSSEWLGWRQRPLAGGGVQRTKRRPCEGSAEQSSLPAQGHGLHTFLLWKDSPKVVTTDFSATSYWMIYWHGTQKVLVLCLVRGWEQVEVTCSPYLKETPSSQWNIEDHINPKCMINSAVAYRFCCCCCCCFHCVTSSYPVISCVVL